MPKDNLLENAVEFAALKHAGKFRKGSKLPYIVHPMEAAAICASFTDDVEVLAAAVLHDVVEDAGATVEELKEKFGSRVAAIVAGESEDKREGMPPAQTWKVRKLEGIEHVRNADDIGVKMVCLGDKLSNIRSIQRDFEELGDAVWQRFNQKDPAEHAWYYSTIADVLLEDLGHTEAWCEYRERVGKVFGGSEPEYKRVRVIKSDWELHRMPRTRTHFKLGIELSNDEFEALAWGYAPWDMAEHWFMYFDGEAFCFHRSWTGFCIYRVYVKRSENPKNHGGYVLYRVTANRSKQQYSEENDERDAVMVKILVEQALGRDETNLWERYFELGE